jgi:GNAT superfamily N-acetyltransferase
MTRKLKARVTHLEMRTPPARRAAMPSRPRLALMRAPDMPLSFYRYLYEQVGRPHHWSLRRAMDDDTLACAIHARTARIHVLYADGAPAGFFEIDLSGLPGTAEILYLGLTPDFQGRGLGRFLLSEAIAAAWAEHPEKVTIHTNTLDSPRALRLYQLAGFIPVGFEEVDVDAGD